MDTLTLALMESSPRLRPPATPLRSLLIHGCVLMLWLLLILAAFRLGGVFAWSVGIAYIVYDTVLLMFVSWQLRHLARTSAQSPAQAADTLPVSLGVIVAAYNEAAALPLTIAALLQQVDAPDRIVIADDGSTDGTAELLIQRYGLEMPAANALSEPAAAHPSLRWLRVAHGGKARALNAAALHLDTDVVLTVDADTLLDADAVAAFRHAFSTEPELVAATGVLTPICGRSFGASILQWFQTYEYIRNFLSRYAWMRAESLLLISGAFAGFRRREMLAVGGFDPDCLVEDYELVHRLRRHAGVHATDWRFRVLGDAQARTDAPNNVPAFLRQRQRWFGGFLQTQYWYRAMVGSNTYGKLGTLMLPIKAVDTLQPFYGLSAFVLLLAYLVGGQFKILLPVSAVIGTKIAIDLAFHMASVRWYRLWVQDTRRIGLGAALLAALAEPFSFQLLRHSGAVMGWWSFLSGRRQWARQNREGVLANTAAHDG
ncbi:glycosyltransferase family 2 protein [Solimonas terrae]|uniref:Glycosyltransferase family 2 protein n=1 Tax=Solimonas terrae TaxID=1396819 RepID=A0A6M2BMH9_9GAMM|nr:glycosyltransferase family 2 protein [Solimonas terrae]NGY03862.1 glycosyltransferase family 2 protein [Solimonas terrae]